MSRSRLRIGLDLDNTIVCYDDLFRELAVERGLISPEAPLGKRGLRKLLRERDQESVWTYLQGEAYGARMGGARLFPGVRELFAAARSAGAELRIVSHRSRTPYGGQQYDLHRCAREWLRAQRLMEPDQLEQSLFLELTVEAKIERITALQCSHFVDDMRSVLTHRDFPASTQALHFAPGSEETPPTDLVTVRSWGELQRLLLERDDG